VTPDRAGAAVPGGMGTMAIVPPGRDTLLEGTPYGAYVYAYPHKTSYSPLDPPVPLRDAWAREDRSALSLYLHVPFCEMRCGFCNLFTTANPDEDMEDAYLAALERQARRVSSALGPVAFARLAIGGGTPTYLAPRGLHRLFDVAERVMGAARAIPMSVETSPRTADRERLAVLAARGVDRVSIGVQSFFDEEARAVGRPQRRDEVDRALRAIRAAGIATVNIDLIYGMPGQDVERFLASVRAALDYQPEELYLYPLYVRPLTGLDRRGPRAWDDIRLACYRAARDLLLSEGYTQVSMRMFRAAHAPIQDAPVYCCQDDGMVGLGCGARSYTRALHYATEYAVGRHGVRAILADYIGRAGEAFDAADYGIRLDGEEQRRRYIIQSLLQADGLDLDAYAARFGSRALADIPDLSILIERGLAQLTRVSDARLVLTPAGLERSDAVGPWLYSAATRARMEEYTAR